MNKNEYEYPKNCYYAIFGTDKELPQDAAETMEYIMDTLNPREAEMFMLKFRDSMSYVEIGKKFGLSGERVRQIILKTVRGLGHPSQSKILLMGREAYLAKTSAQEEFYQSEDDANVSISVLNLSLHAWNALARAGIQSELMDCGDSLIVVRCLGQGGVVEIQEKLKTYIKRKSEIGQ